MQSPIANLDDLWLPDRQKNKWLETEVITQQKATLATQKSTEDEVVRLYGSRHRVSWSGV
jgi:hypothetical protein